MNVLMIRPNPFEEPELSEYLRNHNCRVFIANCQKEVCQTLLERAIDRVFYNVEDMDDFTIIRYINEHYPLIKVVLISETGLGNIIENIRRVHFDTIQRPFHLNQLNELIGATNIKQTQTKQ